MKGRRAVLAACAASAVTLTLLVAHLAGVRMWSVISGSMEPAIPQGAVVITIPHAEPAVGEVYLYDHPGYDEPVLHRYYGTADSGELIFQGDANVLPDQPVHPEQLTGRMVVAVPLPRSLENLLGAAAADRAGAMLTAGLTAAGIGALAGAGWVASRRRAETQAA